jgi:predicted nucleic acid-binding protein
MPGDRPHRSYWDACVFLAWLNGEPGRASVVDSLLRSARVGELSIVTSVLSIAEVAFAAAEKKSGALSPAMLAAIDKLWEPPSSVTLVEVHRQIATDARDLMRAATPDGRVLRAPDAIHLSTARRTKCDEFLTYDPGLNKYAGVIGLPVREPVSDELPLDFGPGAPPGPQA